jgi:hypothetical protein
MGFQNMHPWWDAKIERERVFVKAHKLSGLISWARGGLHWLSLAVDGAESWELLLLSQVGVLPWVLVVVGEGTSIVTICPFLSQVLCPWGVSHLLLGSPFHAANKEKACWKGQIKSEHFRWGQKGFNKPQQEVGCEVLNGSSQLIHGYPYDDDNQESTHILLLLLLKCISESFS